MAASDTPTIAADPTASATRQSPAPSADRWLWSRSVDLLFGCGLLYGLIFVILAVAGPAIRLAEPGFVSPLLILLISTPHYGATLVRVYEEATERRRYVLFATWLSLAVWGVVALGLFSTTLASLLATVLFTWSPWHYTGQNYGIAMLFLRRRGVEVSTRAKRLLYGSFILSFAMIFLNMNATGSAPSATPRGYTATDLQFISLDIPPAIAANLLALLMVGFSATLIGAWVELSRKARVRDLIPSALLCLGQFVWFTLPIIVIRWRLLPGVESLNLEHRTYYFLWVGIAHGAQYLWITSYYGKALPRWKGVRGYWGKTLLAGTAVWTFPLLLFGAMSAYGPTGGSSGALSYGTGLGLLVAAGVNLHHFMLDGVIWKLRNMRIASVLIRDAPKEDLSIEGSVGAGVLARRIVWGLASVALAISLFAFVQESVINPLAWQRNDYAAVGRTLDRLAWFNFDGYQARAQLGDVMRAKNDSAGSIPHYRASLRLKPGTPRVHYSLANALRSEGQTDLAISHYRSALALQPDFADAHYNLGNAMAGLARYDEAIEAYRNAIAARSDFARAHNNLGNALQTLGDLDAAIEEYREAIRIQPGYASATDNLGRALRQKW